MMYEDLHQRYGSHIAKRVQLELSPTEFRQIIVNELPTYLETRAELAHREYQTRIDNPFVSTDKASKNVDTLYNRWRDAEDLAYLISIAEDVSATTRLVMAAGR
ncbi:MAG TPA: hypothetical protein VFR09_09365 [Alphaproteobacteria bacterium]|nr:hypothetical protein [Alphaproteobacteria bacterium]